MRTAALLVRRARAQAGTLATLVVLVAAIAAVLAGSVGYTRAATVATVRSTLSEAPATASGVQVQTRLADDAAAQDAAARAEIERLLGAVDVQRTLRTEPVTLGSGPQEHRVVLAELPPETAVVVVGELPGADEVLVPEAVAAEAGLEAGSEATVDGTPVTVSGTWQAADPQGREWFGEPLIAGADEQASGLVLASADTIVDLARAPFVRWTVHPQADRLTAADLPALANGVAALERALADDDAVAVRGLTVSGELAGTVAELRESTSTASAVGLVPVALLAIISLVALVQVVRLLGQARAREVEILVARGAAPRTVTAWALAESSVVAVVGAVLGAAAAVAFVSRLDGGEAQLPIVLGAAVVTAVLAVVTGTAVAGLQARRVARRLVTDRSGRAQSAAALGSVVLTVVAAALASWQLLRHGTPLIGDVDGGTRADVLAVLSLGAVLAALAMLALALLGPATRAVAALQARRRPLPGVLASRQVSRRVRAYAVPVVLVVLATAATTTAAAFSGATAAQREQVAALATGTDVRLTLPAAATSRQAQPQATSSAPYGEVDGVAGAGVVLRRAATLGELPVAVTALDTQRVEQVVRAPAQLELPAAAAGLVPDGDDDDSAGIDLPTGAETLELTVQAHTALTAEAQAAAEQDLAGYRELLLTEGFSEDEADELLAEAEEDFEPGTTELSTTLWVADGEGAVSMLGPQSLEAPAAPDGATHTLSFELPTSGEYRLVGLDVDLDRPDNDVDLSYAVTALTAGGQDVPLTGAAWELAAVSTTDTSDVEPEGPVGLRGEIRYDWQLPSALTYRLVPAGAPAAVPALVTTHLAEAAHLAVGDSAGLNVSGVPVEVTVSDVVAAVPGGLEQDAVLLDLNTLGRYVLDTQLGPLLPGQVWLTVADGAEATDVAAAAVAVAGPQAAVEVGGAGPADSTAPVRDTFWIAAAGAVALALTGVAAVVLAMARERRSEVMVLRALGLSPGGQARSRAGELLGTGVLGVVLGIAAGLLASGLLVPTLARAAATQTSPLTLTGRLDGPPALALLGVLLAGLVVVALVLAGRVRAQARDAEYREEVR